MLNRLNSIPEPTRYRVVVLTSWDRTYRNLLAKLHQHPLLGIRGLFVMGKSGVAFWYGLAVVPIRTNAS
jgi:hypothetical protein